MDDLAKIWQERFTKVWDPDGEGQYRLGSCGARLVPQFMSYVKDGHMINDYGSGTGRAVVAIRENGSHKINMVDIAPNALEEEARNMIGVDLTLTIAPLWDLPADFPHADWGYCVDVLMTVPPEKLDDILKEIRCTCDNLFVEVYDWPDVRLGVDLTTIKEGPEWWEAKLREYWIDVRRAECPEHPRRYVFVCRCESVESIQKLKDEYKGQTCYIVGRGASLLCIGKEHFGEGPVIALNEAIQNISLLGLDNDIYSQWRNGDVLSDLPRYLKPGDAMILCENPVLQDPPSASLFTDYAPRGIFECERDLGCDPRATFSHKAALEIAVQIFGCTRIVMMGFDSYRGDVRTILGEGFIHSEFRPGDYHEQIEVIRKRLASLENVEALWFFPDKGMENTDLLRLNIGCGPVRELGYINIDMHDPGADVRMDARALIYEDNSVDEIYSSHLLEHFGKDEILPVLKEWIRVLKPGGVLKMNLPNLEWCLKNWLAHPECQRWGLALNMIFGNQANPGEYHKTGFSKPHLECYLRRAGFDNIVIADHWSHEQLCFWVECRKK